MIHAVSFALADSVNLLLIGILLALGVMLGPTARYGRVAALVVAGDWAGVLAFSAVTMLAFDQIREHVAAVLDSAIFGIVLIAVGVVSAVLAYRSDGSGGENRLVAWMMGPLRTPSPKTASMGFILGAVQSATSVPFYTGLGYLVVADLPVAARYGGLTIYATLALSLPIICALLIGWLRRFPALFARARERAAGLSKAGGYLVAVFLIVMGIMAL